MYRLFRFYNQNRKTIWITIGTVILVFGVIKTLDGLAGRKNRTSSSINTTTYSAIIENPNYSVISGKEVSSKKATYVSNEIDAFINNCNMGNIEESYNMLSEDCKNALYKTKQEFEEKYYNVYFKTKKMYSYKAWISERDTTIYRIEFTEDLLSTGGNSNKKQEDYYTVVNENGEYKLNINKYMGNAILNKQIVQNNIRITVLSKDVYLENVIYNFKIENFNDNDISLAPIGKTNTVILQDSNDLKYTAATWEMIGQDLTVHKKSSKTISIKFLREYKVKFIEKMIEFNEVNLNNGSNVSIKIELN